VGENETEIVHVSFTAAQCCRYFPGTKNLPHSLQRKSTRQRRCIRAPRPDAAVRAHKRRQRPHRSHRRQLVHADKRRRPKAPARSKRCHQRKCSIIRSRTQPRIPARRRNVDQRRCRRAGICSRNREIPIRVAGHRLRQQRCRRRAIARSPNRVQLQRRPAYRLLPAMHTAVPQQRLSHLCRLILRTSAKQEGQQEKSTNNTQRKPMLSNKGQGEGLGKSSRPSLAPNTSAIKLIHAWRTTLKSAALVCRSLI
jgi:hypothetical protein